MSQHYELMFIISVKLDEEAQESVLKKVEDLISQNGGTITNKENWGNRQLAYEIEHQTSGNYFIIEFDADNQLAKILNRELRLMSGLLRYMIVKKRVKTAAEKAKEDSIQKKIAARKAAEEEKAKITEQAAAEKSSVRSEQKEAKEEPLREKGIQPEKEGEGDKNKISLDDLDKKLDEILKEDI